MGMYTQVRGWLNVDSIGDYTGGNYIEIEKKLLSAQEGFQRDTTITDLYGIKPMERKWVCQDTVLHKGGNGSVYIFFGTELKNYGNPAGQWIKYLLNFFPNAEGRIDFQYEEDESECDYWLISRGKILKEESNPIWCIGYGNMLH
ncbi:hypothetical protein [Clostridium sp. HBUAS56010]|uniref:hypothetical protein n=1 Tax=Clostridium sp. HBUAS56010 TaxID=2571127 RepID=UPI0011774730|nr:hypothetical protein [Clostridium sp. HBUAS56010]